MTTEQYVRSPEFEVIGVAIGIENEAPVWYPQPEVAGALAAIDWSDKLVLAQNTAFDAAIMAWRYNINPLAWLDTLGMSRALFPHAKAHSLSAQAERHGVGVKGDEVINALGLRYADFDSVQLAKYAQYCINDVVLTKQLFDLYMGMGFPKIELKLIDLTLRMFVEPVLILDKPKLQLHLKEVKELKAGLLDEVRDMMLAEGDPDYVHAVFSEGTEGIKKLLMSNEKFAALLRSYGVEPPKKISPATKKSAYAFAKTDEEFKALGEHPDVRVQGLVAARLGNRTTIEETRTERFIDMSDRGPFPIPLRYYGAHSGRWSGQDSVNMQNLPSRGVNAGRIKKAIMAPEGYVVIDCDSAQIEARVLAWLAGQDDLVEAFERREDVYKIMASNIYGVPVLEITGPQRTVGKTVVLGCFGPETPVLTPRGWVPILHVQATDMVWDGLRWVPHAGVIPQGEKDVWTMHGLSATSDHEILTERGWAAWSEVCESPQTLRSARAVANLLSLSGGHINPHLGGLSAGTLFANVHVGGSAPFYVRTLAKVVALGAILAPKLRRTLSGIGSMKAYAQTKLREAACSIGCQPAYLDATTQTASRTNTMGGGVYTSTSRGEPTASHFSRTCLRLADMTSKLLSWTGLTWIGGMSRAIFASWGVQPMWQIAAASARYKNGLSPLRQRMQTYDIAYAGPRNRYTVLTTEGPLVVHNCGYGVGAVKLRLFLKTQAKVVVDDAESVRIVQAYRGKYSRIPLLWRKGEEALRALAQGQTMTLDAQGLLEVVPGKGIRLPNGMYIQYPGLKKIVGEDGKNAWVYYSKGVQIYVYGGKVIENVCQAVARIVIGEQMLRIAKRYKVVLTVHDAVAVIAKGAEAKEAQKFVEECMNWRPKWALTLPLACESGVGKSYGDC